MGLLAAMVALLLGAASRGELDFAKVELLCASSVITAFLAALALGELCPNPSTFLLPAGPMLHSQHFVAFSSKKNGALLVGPWASCQVTTHLVGRGRGQ